jgi:pimeloyl-ACP methyl ester carboxylesterase
MKSINIEFEDIIGRYLNINVDDTNYRIYVEEAGQGIPLLCLHTAGSDGRQFRHILNDQKITKNFRVIAFDLPWHGKSNPPEGYELNDYKLTTSLYKKIIMSFCDNYKLNEPVIMGCSMGGRVVLHLALEQSNYFKAVIALEGSDKLEPYYDLDWLYRPDIHGGLIQSAFVSSQIAPQSPDKFRHETLWHYMQGGPGIFKGDLYFYWHDGDFDDRSGLIDTSKCPVYLLSGEYDCSCTPERTLATASRIKGAKATIIPGIGHFPMSENPELFKSYIYPILDEILK